MAKSSYHSRRLDLIGRTQEPSRGIPPRLESTKIAAPRNPAFIAIPKDEQGDVIRTWNYLALISTEASDRIRLRSSSWSVISGAQPYDSTPGMSRLDLTLPNRESLQ
jgi:hypothetical protein